MATFTAGNRAQDRRDARNSLPGTLQIDPPEPIWVCRDGTKTTVKKMTKSHLLNAISYCKRNGFRLDWLPSLNFELSRRK